MAWCQALVDRSNWGAKGELSEEVREELRFWRDRLDEFSGQLIRHQDRGVLRVFRQWGSHDWGLCEVQGDRADRKEISDNSGGVGEEVEFNLQRIEVHRAWDIL